MYTPDQIDSILYQAYVKIGDIAIEVTDLKNKGVRCECLYKQGYCLRNYMSAYEKGRTLTDKQKEALLNCIIKVSEIKEYPSAAPILFINPPAINVGQVGPKGNTGETGDTGAQGDIGLTGDQGDDGPQGPKGDDGDTGLTGAIGSTGDQGIQGIQGDQGIQGIQGDDGPQGPAGTPGSTGATGDQGPQGPTGDTGATGSTGPVGADGADGNDGADGADGVGSAHLAELYLKNINVSGQSVSNTPVIMNQWDADHDDGGGVVSGDETTGEITFVGSPNGWYRLDINLETTGVANKSYLWQLYVDDVAVDGAEIETDYKTDTERSVSMAFSFDASLLSADAVLDIRAANITDATSNTILIKSGSWGVFTLGQAGPAGATGGTGAQGATGSQGAAGSDGAAGSTGATGATGPAGVLGKAFVVGDPDITLTAAKITAILGGSYTPEDPYVASVFFDNRADKASPAAITGDMTGHTIQYDGTDWFDNGIWRGPQGIQGNSGPTGATGATGATGLTGAQGNTGAQGIQGIKGDQGDEGPTGPEGPAGAIINYTKGSYRNSAWSPSTSYTRILTVDFGNLNYYGHQFMFNTQLIAHDHASINIKFQYSTNGSTWIDIPSSGIVFGDTHTNRPEQVVHQFYDGFARNARYYAVAVRHVSLTSLQLQYSQFSVFRQ